MAPCKGIAISPNVLHRLRRLQLLPFDLDYWSFDMAGESKCYPFICSGGKAPPYCRSSVPLILQLHFTIGVVISISPRQAHTYYNHINMSNRHCLADLFSQRSSRPPSNPSHLDTSQQGGSIRRKIAKLTRG